MLGAMIKPKFEAPAKENQANSTGGINPQLKADLPEANPETDLSPDEPAPFA
jgi:hypothetical protein